MAQDQSSSDKVKQDPLGTDFDAFLPESDELAIVRKIEWFCYTGCKKFWYNLFSIIISIPLSAIWGMFAAFLQFISIWFLSPMLKLMKMIMVSMLSIVSIACNNEEKEQEPLMSNVEENNGVNHRGDVQTEIEIVTNA